MTLNADVFADALDGTATDLLEDTERMLGVVERLHGLPGTAALSNAGARPDFRSELRARLLEQAGAPVVGAEHAARTAKVVPITSRWNESWARRNRGRLLTSAAAGVIIITAVSVGASNALPGNPLYPVKRGGESVEYALAGSDEARGKLELSFARTRLNEIGRLTSHDAAFGIAPVTGIQAAGGTTILATSTNTWVVRLFGQMDDNAVKGSTLLARSFKNNPRPAPLREVQEFALFQEAQLKLLKGRLAGPALTKATFSLNWATAAVKRTTAALTKCTGNTCPAAVGAALSATVVPLPSASPTPLPSATPSAPPSVAASDLTPSAPALVPPPSSPVTEPTTGAPAQTTPTPPVDLPPTPPAPATTPAPTPTDTPTQPTTEPTSPTAPSSSPTTSTTPTPSPSATDTLTPAPTTQQPDPTTEPVTTTPAPVVPTTLPPTTDPVTTTPAPAPPTTTPAPPTTTAPATTTPPTTVPPPTTPPPTTPAPPTTTPAPPTTTPPTTAPPTSPPILVCLPGGHLVHGICIRLPGPPGRD